MQNLICQKSNWMWTGTEISKAQLMGPVLQRVAGGCTSACLEMTSQKFTATIIPDVTPLSPPHKLLLLLGPWPESIFPAFEGSSCGDVTKQSI